MDTDKYDIEPVLDPSGQWRLAATPKECGALPFWYGDEMFPTYGEAIASSLDDEKAE